MSSPVPEETQALIAAAADGTLDGDGRDQLAEILASSEPAREHYLRYLHLAALLEDQNHPVRDTISAPAKHPRRVPYLAIASIAALLVATVTVITFWPSAKPIASPTLASFVSDAPPTVVAIEISASMAADGRKFVPVVDRVFEQLAQLEASQSFTLLAFATERIFFRPGPIAASPENLAAARDWILSLRPDATEAPAEWPSPEWGNYEAGRHFGADLFATMEYCFRQEPARIIYATDWVMEPGSIRTSKQQLIESIRRWQDDRLAPAQLDVVVYQEDGHNRFLSEIAKENGGSYLQSE